MCVVFQERGTGLYTRAFCPMTSRDSSVGRASDWRSEGRWFDPGLWRILFCHSFFLFLESVRSTGPKLWKSNSFSILIVFQNILGGLDESLTLCLHMYASISNIYLDSCHSTTTTSTSCIHIIIITCSLLLSKLTTPPCNHVDEYSWDVFSASHHSKTRDTILYSPNTLRLRWCTAHQACVPFTLGKGLYHAAIHTCTTTLHCSDRKWENTQQIKLD